MGSFGWLTVTVRALYIDSIPLEILSGRSTVKRAPPVVLTAPMEYGLTTVRLILNFMLLIVQIGVFKFMT